jgi:hypothetical protein
MAESFAERWAAKEREHGLESIAARMIPIGTDVLPHSAAPCVSFEEADHPRPIYDTFASPSDWSPDDLLRLRSFPMIGSDGAGNPICLNQNTGEVVLLDHEDWFRTQMFVNSSIKQLSECLLAYLGEDDRDRFLSFVAEVDPRAIQERSFWCHESADLGSAT